MPKIKIFIWQVCHNILPVRGTLLRRGLIINPACPLCLGDIESIEHIFKDCPLVHKVWDLAAQHSWLPPTLSPPGCPDLFSCLNKIKSSHNSQALQKFSFLLWSIWKSRNEMVFNNEIFNPVACLIRAKKASAEWRIRTCMSVDHYSRGSSSSPGTPSHLVRWYPPPPGFVKLNFDGSLINSSAAGGFIIRDWTGRLIKAGATYYGDTSILVAEARALRDGLRLAIQAGFTNIIIEGDNKTVIQALKGMVHVPWKISTIIEDIHAWQTHGIQLTITHVFREANMAADWLSKFGHSITASFSSDMCFSPFLSVILAEDVVGRTLVRRGV